MNNPFFEISKEIANNFLQSIVFIDDEAYSKDDDKYHDLSPSDITRAFAKSQKICSIYNPIAESDITDLINISKKADIVVIDWKINLQQEKKPSADEEKDDEQDDPRGTYTLKIIQEILLDPILGSSSLKLILVYTGETDLWGITDAIYDQLKSTISKLQKNDCEVSTENFKVIVIGKPTLKATTERLPEFAAKIKEYDELPDFILTEFTKMTSGLVPGFILRSLSVLRQNTFRLLSLFNKGIDPAFLAHRALLPNQEDSQEQLIELLSHSINALLNYNKVGQECISTEKIEMWIDSNEFTNTINFGRKTIDIDKVFIKDWIRNGFIEACKNKWVTSGHGNPTAENIKNFENKGKEIWKEGSKYFHGDDKFMHKDYEFSILTHQKSNLKQPSTPPKLTLGTILKYLPKGSTEFVYYVCIQQKCDSVRVEEGRRFMFLPLNIMEGGKKFDFVIEEKGNYYRLKVDYQTYNLRTIKFSPQEGLDTIKALKDNDENYYFESFYKEKFIWLSDLKDAHAQRVANNYASKLSRVGLDESEWLRRSAT